MPTENDLIQKLMISKKIMDKHNTMSRNQNASGIVNVPQNIQLEEFETPKASYNIPQEFMTEARVQPQTSKVSTKEKILSSKLPDEIKRLMIEHPISQPNNFAGPTLSNELVEKASRLMGNNSKTKPKSVEQEFSGLDANTIKSIVRETIEEVLSENGLLTESTSKSNEMFSFRVGSHRFEGKLTKIVKVK